MATPIDPNNTNRYSEQEILQYVDRVIKEAPAYTYFRPSDFFTMYEFPPFVEGKERLLGLGYIEYNTNVTYKLTPKGLQAKKAGGHFEFEKSENLKQVRSANKDRYDFTNSITEAKTKWIMVLIGIISVLIAAIALK